MNKIVCQMQKVNGYYKTLLYIDSMRPFTLYILSFLLLPFLLGACSSKTRTIHVQTLTPVNFGPVDPDDKVLSTAVREFLETTEGPVASRYEFARIDLNGDSRRDALVLFQTPYGYWCGIHGCTMLVLKAHDDKFTLVNDIQPIREPVYVSNLKSNGWRNLAVRISGRAEEAKDVAMLYDGRQYPSDPSQLPPYHNNGDSYTRVLYD